MSSLKQKLRNGETTIGSWITMTDTSIAEIMAKAGFDWLSVDMEHSAITMDQTKQLVQVIDLCGIPVLVRVGENDFNLIKRVMDAGAHGVIVPMVNSREDAVDAVAAVKYPPTGKRGVGLSRAQGYGTKFEEYKKWVEEESVVIVQIEHIDAVNNLEEILSVKGIDGFMVGPYDLSGSMGMPGDFDCPQMKRTLKRIMDVAKAKNVTAGFHVVPPKPDLVKEKINEGFQFISYSVDFLLLGEKCREGLSQLKVPELLRQSY